MDRNPPVFLAVRLLLLTPRLRPDDIAPAVNQLIVPPLVTRGLWTPAVRKLFDHFDRFYYQRLGRHKLSVFGNRLNSTTSPLEGAHHRLNEAQVCQTPPFWALYRKYSTVVTQCSL